METRRNLKKQRDDAERRAMTHFRTIIKIANILDNADINRENYVFTVEKIKRALVENN